MSVSATQIEHRLLFFLVFGCLSFLSPSLFGREVMRVGGQTREDWEVSVIGGVCYEIPILRWGWGWGIASSVEHYPASAL